MASLFAKGVQDCKKLLIDFQNILGSRRKPAYIRDLNVLVSQWEDKDCADYSFKWEDKCRACQSQSKKGVREPDCDRFRSYFGIQCEEDEVAAQLFIEYSEFMNFEQKFEFYKKTNDLLTFENHLVLLFF